MMHIPPFRYAFTDDDADFVADAMRTLLRRGDFLTVGEYNALFEEEFRLAHRAAYAVAVSSGTAALEILLRTAEVTGRKVIAPSNTFGATLVSILRAGATPILAECEEDFSLDPADVERRLTSDVAAIVVVHIGGSVSANLPRLAALCAKHGVPLIEDAAHATGASLAGRPAGTWGFGGAFSFFSTKVITTGEGGMLVTNDRRTRDIACLLRDHAKRPDGGMDTTGYNWRLSEPQALLGIAQMRRLPSILSERRRVATRYAAAVEGIAGISVVAPMDTAGANRYKQIIRLPASMRDHVRRSLRQRYCITLGGEVYAVPCHRQPAFAAYANGPLPVTDALCAGHICPPILPNMSDAELDHACSSLRTVLSDTTELPAVASGSDTE